jgi:hypothetical protein
LLSTNYQPEAQHAQPLPTSTFFCVIQSHTSSSSNLVNYTPFHSPKLRFPLVPINTRSGSPPPPEPNSRYNRYFSRLISYRGTVTGTSASPTRGSSDYKLDELESPMLRSSRAGNAMAGKLVRLVIGWLSCGQIDNLVEIVASDDIFTVQPRDD